MDQGPYLVPTAFIDSDHAHVSGHARALCDGVPGARERAVRLFYAVRDDVRYTVRVDFTDPAGYRASATLARGNGFCVPKAILLVALARAVGIPARLHFADLRNRLVPRELRVLMGTDVFAYHGYVELWLQGRWIKATPSFDARTYARHGIVPVEFDGRRDALLHPNSVDGRPQFEYIADHGVHADLPLDEILVALRETYPHYDPTTWGSAFGEDGPDA